VCVCVHGIGTSFGWHNPSNSIRSDWDAFLQKLALKFAIDGAISQVELPDGERSMNECIACEQRATTCTQWDSFRLGIEVK